MERSASVVGGWGVGAGAAAANVVREAVGRLTLYASRLPRRREYPEPPSDGSVMGNARSKKLPGLGAVSSCNGLQACGTMSMMTNIQTTLV